jgi:hypothetical protein
LIKTASPLDFYTKWEIIQRANGLILSHMLSFNAAGRLA